MMPSALPSVALNIRVRTVIVTLQFLRLKRVIATISVVRQSGHLSQSEIATQVWALAQENLAVILVAIASVLRSIITGLDFVIVLPGLFHCANASMFVTRKVIGVTWFEFFQVILRELIQKGYILTCVI